MEPTIYLTLLIRLLIIFAFSLLILWTGEPDIHDQFIAWMGRW